VNVTERVARVLAPNPSPMTLDGTNSYLLDAGNGSAVAIDPGPPIEAHVDALLAQARARSLTIEAIAVTHGHPDHAPAAALLHAATGAPVYAHEAARFPHDRVLGDGDELRLGEIALRVMDAPGHARDHLVFYLEAEGALFTGDVIIGRGTIVIAPPNGDMRAYQRTLHRLRDEFASASRIYGGHGEALDTPLAKIDEYIAHRELRERELLEALASGPQTVPALVRRIYAAVSPVLWPAAARQMLAYLIALEREGRVSARVLERAPTAEESALLSPDLSRIVDPASLAVAAAELGVERPAREIAEYALR
jgi:glyoxylase-like metal-dependent hydrolase (beta-lactamase superfamily II)